MVLRGLAFGPVPTVKRERHAAAFAASLTRIGTRNLLKTAKLLQECGGEGVCQLVEKFGAFPSGVM